MMGANVLVKADTFFVKSTLSAERKLRWIPLVTLTETIIEGHY